MSAIIIDNRDGALEDPTEAQYDVESPNLDEREVGESPRSCLICYEDLSNDDIESKIVEKCQHEFCGECLKQHCHHAISARQLPVPCPCRNNATQSCPENLSPSLIESLLANKAEDCQDAWRLYQKLEQLTVDPTLKTCPWCDALVRPDEQENSTISCRSCQRNFCTIHGSAHPEESCEQYLSRCNQSKEFMESIQVIQLATKACSHCSGRILKEAGCDHVVCPACHQDMCYRCGSHEYLSGKVVRFCEKCNRGYLDHRHEFMYRMRIIIFLPFLVPLFFAYSILMLALAIITGGFGCCFGGGRFLTPPLHDQVEQSSWERAVRFGLAIIAVPFIGIMRDLGLTSCRLPHEIYLGLRAEESMDENKAHEIPTMHILDDIEFSTSNSSSNESSSNSSAC